MRGQIKVTLIFRNAEDFFYWSEYMKDCKIDFNITYHKATEKLLER